MIRIDVIWLALGASDLPNISHEHVLVQGEIGKIKAHLQALPGEAAERHPLAEINAVFAELHAGAAARGARLCSTGWAVASPVADAASAVDPANPWTHFREATWEEALTRAADAVAPAESRTVRVTVKVPVELKTTGAGSAPVAVEGVAPLR